MSKRLTAEEAKELAHRVVSRHSVEFVAKQCGITTSAVQHWLAGNNGMQANNAAILTPLVDTPDEETSQYEVTGVFIVAAASLSDAMSRIVSYGVNWSSLSVTVSE